MTTLFRISVTLRQDAQCKLWYGSNAEKEKTSKNLVNGGIVGRPVGEEVSRDVKIKNRLCVER